MIGAFDKPEYLFRPQQILGRLRRSRGWQVVRTAWGVDIECDTTEAIGRSILHHGIYELPLSEVIVRLLEPGETAIDVGANIGHMAGLMAMRVGATGRVLAFEPGPAIKALRNNVARWSMKKKIGPIEVIEKALSDREDSASLYAPQGYARNSGVCTLESRGQSIATVQLTRLDAISVGSVGLIKIDVEGCEADVIRGAERLFLLESVRDVLFEEQRPFPATSHQLMIQHGYTLFLVSRRFLGPVLLPSTSPQSTIHPNNYLATRKPQRAMDRCASRGWTVLK